MNGAEAGDLLDYDDAQVEDQQPEQGVQQQGNVGLSSTGFKDLNLKPPLLRAIQDCGFEHPSEVQHQCLPHTVLGMDVLCQAKSGMGKTAVFVLTLLQSLEPGVDESGVPKVAAIVMCHTRELAYQIKEEFKRFARHVDVRAEAFFGGKPISEDKKLLRSKEQAPHVIIGTPGRIKGLVQDGSLHLGHVQYFVLDECDKMLETTDMRGDVQYVFQRTPVQKQVMMFSATMSEDVKTLAKKFMAKLCCCVVLQNAVKVFVDDEAKLTLHGLVQHYLMINEDEKNKKLIDLLDNLDFNQVVIFCKAVNRAEALCNLLQQCNFPSDKLIGRMGQEDRMAAFTKFKEGKTRILVATDLVGRGVDVERVNIVINYDMPETDEVKGNGADTYLHRVGRAGRFGTKGLAITFVSSEQDSQVLNMVQERFDVDIKPLPDSIDAEAYMNA
eukprot:jgi/Astpho2/7850/Aster-06136